MLAGKYHLHEALGAGAFSRVIRATHKEMGREVAIKFLDVKRAVAASNTTADRITQRFLREAKLSSQLKHPNSITVYDFGEHRGHWYIVMELVRGVTLFDALRGGAFEPRRAATIGREIALSLTEAHHLGFLHRDLKPTNVMLTEDFAGDEQVKVLDFGIATGLDVEKLPEDLRQLDATRSGTFVGTPRYAAPEQFLSEPLSPATDVYALGLILWEMVVGTPAIPTSEFGPCLKVHLSPNPWQLPADADVPRPLADIIHRALRKAPQERYDSARALGDDLDAWLMGRSNTAESALGWDTTLVDAGFDDNELSPLLGDSGRMTFDPNLDDHAEPEFLRRDEPKIEEEVAPTSSPRGQRGGLASIPKFKEAKIELDLHAVESTRPRPRPTTDQHVIPDIEPVGKAQKSNAPTLPVSTVLAIAAVAVGGLLLASTLFVRAPEPPLKIDVDDIAKVEVMHLEEFENSLREPEAQLDNHYPTAAIIRALETAGWSTRKLPDAQTLANTHEQGYRISRDETSMEIRVVTATSRHIAQTMFDQTKPPLSVVLLDNKLVRIFPPQGRPHPEVSTVASTLREYRDAVRSGRQERP